LRARAEDKIVLVYGIVKKILIGRSHLRVTTGRGLRLLGNSGSSINASEAASRKRSWLGKRAVPTCGPADGTDKSALGWPLRKQPHQQKPERNDQDDDSGGDPEQSVAHQNIDQVSGSVLTRALLRRLQPRRSQPVAHLRARLALAGLSQHGLAKRAGRKQFSFLPQAPRLHGKATFKREYLLA
jgi:hypothetical protein